MKTLKQFLEDSNLTISNNQRFDLGFKLARLWDKKGMGEKTHTKEDSFVVRTYPKQFLDNKSVGKLVIKYLKTL